MFIKKLLCAWATFWLASSSFCQSLGVNASMVAEVRFRFDEMARVFENEGRVKAVARYTGSQVEACSTDECVYSAYIDGLYKLSREVWKYKKCPVNVAVLGGEWLNEGGVGYYKRISLSVHAGRSTVHHFSVFKDKIGPDLEDGFGGWYLKGCTIKTTDRFSNSGRVFVRGHDLVVLAYDRSEKQITLLDGDFMALFRHVN